MKRKILNEEPGPITEKEVTDLFSKLQMAGILNAAFDLKKQNDPQDFIGALNGHQPFSSSKNIAVDGSKPLAIKDLIEAKVGTDPIQDEQTTLNVFIQRNLATNKTTNQITIEKTIEIPDGSGSHFELVGATVHRGDQVAAGHFVAYSYQNGKWYECNDETVSEVLDEKKLLESLSTSATELVYRKLPQPINQLLESEVAPLHSLSLVDTDRWVTSKVVLDWAEKNAEKKENTTVVHTTTPATPLFKVGNGVDLRDLGAEIDKINEGQTAFIPLIKVKDSTDQASKHFVALVVDKSKDPHSYEYFDSTGKAIPQELDTLIKSKNNNQSPLIIVDQANAWQQDDGYRCGYYVSRFFELRADNDAETIQKNQDERHPNVNQVNELRLRMRLNYNRFQDNYGFHG
jgi:hypothetical protein